MPTLEEIDDFSDPDDVALEAPSAPAPRQQASAAAGGAGRGAVRPLMAGGPGLGGQEGYKQVEADVYKKWDVIYPIYIDAKRPQQGGARRVSKEVAVQWPIAEFMAQACGMLNVEAVFEPNKSHPKDWANPGRVKVHLRGEDGQPLSSSIKNKRVLLRRICDLLRSHQPAAPKPSKRRPHPVPPISQRLPAHSPAVSHGVLATAMNGGGLGGMLGNMLGGGGAAEVEEAKVEDPVKKEIKAPPKMKKIHPKKRR